MKFKKLLSLVLAFVLSFYFLLLLPLNSVSADSFSYNLPESYFNSNVSDESIYVTLFNNLKLNSQIKNLDECYIFIKPSSNNLYEVYIWSVPISQYFVTLRPYSWADGYVYFGDSFLYGITSISDASSFVFTEINQLDSTSSTRLVFIPNGNFYININAFYDGSVHITGMFSDFSAGFYFKSSFMPDSDSYQLTGFIIGSDTSMEAFYQWIIDNNKLSELPSYIVSSKLKSLIDFYHTYGGSLTGFIHYLPQWLSYVSLPSQTQENANILKNKLDSLYSEFLNQYKVTIERGNSAIQAHHRINIDTKTDDSDLTLVTDSPSDDIVTSILRDILRGVIAIPVSIYNNTNALLEKLDGLNFTTTVVNNGGVPSGTDINLLLQKMDDIIDALGSDTVSVEIDQNTIDDTDQFFDDWNLEFQSALDDKFPVASQLSTLFTDFWEKCGIDVDNDGDTFEYYNPGVLESRSVARSLDSAGTSESDIVTDFLNQFDDSDPAFLDDASFNSVPDFSVSIGGSDVSIFDFRVYAKYRDKIHFIISLVIWSLYLLHLYKALPTIIGQVADVAVKITDD